MENYVVSDVPGQAPVNYAGFWRRFGAIVIDGLIIGIPAYFLAFLFSDEPSDRLNPNTEEVEAQYFMVYNGISLVVNWLYYALLESSARQATFGKQALGLYVTDLEGRRLTFLRATLRYFGKMLSFLTVGVGFAMAAFTARKQALHDFIANTLVLHK